VKDVTNMFIARIVTRMLSRFMSHEGCDVMQSTCPVPINQRSNQKTKVRNMKQPEHPTPRSRVLFKKLAVSQLVKKYTLWNPKIQ